MFVDENEVRKRERERESPLILNKIISSILFSWLVGEIPEVRKQIQTTTVSLAQLEDLFNDVELGE